MSVRGLRWGPLLYRLALDSPQKCAGMKPRENGGGILYSFAKAATAKPCSLGALNNGSVLSLLEARSSGSRCQQSCFPPRCVVGEFSLRTPMLLRVCVPVFVLIFFVFVFFLLMWTIFKIFIELVTVLLLFYVFGVSATRHVGS